MLVGDVFLVANGELSTLTNIVRVEQDEDIAVFNFTVEGNHNYFILAKEYEYGQTCVLVHNASNYGETAATIAGKRAHQNYKNALGVGYEHQVTLPSGKRPDAVNISSRHVRELKPDNIRAIKQGQKQAMEYANELGRLYPDTNGLPTPSIVKIDTY